VLLGAAPGAPVADEPAVAFGDIRIDLVAESVIRTPDHVIRLTPTEWRILEILVRNPGRLVTREDSLTHIWAPPTPTTADTSASPSPSSARAGGRAPRGPWHRWMTVRRGRSETRD
jgi:DNA-binding response OmpR family regulator